MTKCKAYYNEIDPFLVDWLKNLINEGLIAPGDVDSRDIKEVDAQDLKGYTQCHFFAGIGGWSYALRLAGWPDNLPVWTGSCPCQPFSNAGKQKGFNDERHLWPYWFNLIRECKPTVIFGEQVAGKAALEWMDVVQNNLESEKYAVGTFDICAASVGAPHVRQRLWFVAKRLADSYRFRRKPLERPNTLCKKENKRQNSNTIAGGFASTMENTNDNRQAGKYNKYQSTTQKNDHFWNNADWLLCQDGLWRPVEHRTFPLANGIPKRMEQMRAYGNAIVPQVATEIISAFMELYLYEHD